MSYAQRCDICGKVEGKGKKNAQFDNRPLRLQVPNYNQKPYNIYVDIKIEDNRDTVTIENMLKRQSQMSSKLENMIFDQDPEEDYNIAGYNKEPECDCDQCRQENQGQNPVAIPLKINPAKFINPYPQICNRCRRELLKLVLSYGKSDRTVKF